MNLLNAFGLLNMINEGGADYQKEYKDYVIAHKRRVTKFAEWLKTHCPELFEEVDIDAFDEIIRDHDESKFSEEEFEPYAQKWFGNGEDCVDYELAWQHHWTHNEHHPEYWFGNDMPYIYILEMLCDWGSFSLDKGGIRELIYFYNNKAKNDPEKNLSTNTKAIIEDVLSHIEAALVK